MSGREKWTPFNGADTTGTGMIRENHLQILVLLMISSSHIAELHYIAKHVSFPKLAHRSSLRARITMG